MLTLRHLFNSLWPNYTKFEIAFFRKLTGCLDADRADILISQLKEINFTQRHRGDQEICFYKIKKLLVSHDRMLKFDGSGEMLLCKCKLKFYEQIINAEVWLVNGNFFSVEFDKKMIEYRESEDFQVSIRKTEP